MESPNSSVFKLSLQEANWSREDAYPREERGDLVQGALLVAIALLGAALNVFLMLAILPNPRMRSVRQVLLVHLGVVGLMTSLILTLPAGIFQLLSSTAETNYSHQYTTPAGSSLQHSNVIQPQRFFLLSSNNDASQAWQTESQVDATKLKGSRLSISQKGPLCMLVGASGVLLTAVSAWTVAALAWDKHRAIANPLHHPLVARKSTMAAWLAGLWTLAAALATPPVFGGGDLQFVPALFRCGMHAASASGRWYVIVVVLTGVVAPLSVMIYCYAHIFRIARAQSSRIAATMLRMVTLIQAPIAPPPARNAVLVRLRGTRAMATIVQLVGSCVASYVPWAALLCHQAITDVTPRGIPASTAAILLHAAPLTAATVYGLKNRNLRTSFARFVTRRVQQWCRPHRRRPSVKSLTRNSSSALMRKQTAQNGLSPSEPALRRTCSLQNSTLQAGQPAKAKDLFLQKTRSYNMITTDMALRDLSGPVSSERHDVVQISENLARQRY